MTPEDHQPPTTTPIDPLTIGELISLTEAAELSGFNSDFLRQMINKGRLKARRTGGIWLTTLASVEAYKKTRHRGKRMDLDRNRKSEYR